MLWAAEVGTVGVGSSWGSSNASECAELRDGLDGTWMMDKSESSLPISERVSVVAVVAARVAVVARVIGPIEGVDVLSGAAWGIVIKEEESVPSSSELLWGSLTVILKGHLDKGRGEIEKIRRTQPIANVQNDYHSHH